jgi:putative FmdB family regulatory protein
VPTYDYRCTKCGYTFAIEQSIHDRPLTRCKKCRGKLEKLLPRTLNLIFKGSGFYVTDYKKSGDASGKGGGKRCESKAGSNGHETDTPGPKAARAKCKDVKG